MNKNTLTVSKSNCYILSKVCAIKNGLLQVVPQAVLDLLTWQELERRICGDPNVTTEALKKAGKKNHSYLAMKVHRLKKWPSVCPCVNLNSINFTFLNVFLLYDIQ